MKYNTARVISRRNAYNNRKAIEVSTTTIKGTSKIEPAFYGGIQEYCCCQCPHCKVWHELVFENIHFEYITKKKNGKEEPEKLKAVAYIGPSLKLIVRNGTV